MAALEHFGSPTGQIISTIADLTLQLLGGQTFHHFLWQLTHDLLLVSALLHGLIIIEEETWEHGLKVVTMLQLDARQAVCAKTFTNSGSHAKLGVFSYWSLMQGEFHALYGRLGREAVTERITVYTALENKCSSNKAGPVKPGLEISSQAFCCLCNSVQLVSSRPILAHC